MNQLSADYIFQGQQQRQALLELAQNALLVKFLKCIKPGYWVLLDLRQQVISVVVLPVPGGPKMSSWLSIGSRNISS